MNLTTVTDGGGNATVTDYDGLNRKIAEGKPGTGTAAAWSVGVTGLGASSGGASPRFAAIPLLGIFEAAKSFLPA